ncbi:MAG: hypothetical protein ACLFN8_04855 [Candidatus Woesearchaeota archaeon]
MEECVLCNEYITNPICPECIGVQVKTWLFEVRPDLVKDLDVETLKFSQKIFKENACISCKGYMDICSYCFTEHIFEWLEPLLEQDDLSLFVKFFHYDFFKKGYFKKARLQGLI